MQNWQEKQDALKDKMDKRTPETLDRENKQYEADKARREEEARQAELEAERDKARNQLKNLQSENPTYHVDVYRTTLQNYYGPKPVFHEEYCGKGAGKSYTQEEFNTLQDYSKSLENAGISDNEFTALSMFKAFDPEIGGKYNPKDTVGLTPEEVVCSGMTMITDTVNGCTVRPRDDHGHVFVSVVQPAREKTVEAIEEYKKGNPEKLGEQIGRGLHMLANHYAGKELQNEHFLSVTSMMGDALNLLDRDPKLKAEAEKSMTALAAKDDPTATPEQLKAKVQRGLALANGQRVALDLTRRNEKAKGMLHAESLGLCKLTPEEKRGYIDDRLAFETVQENTADDISFQTNSEAYQTKSAELGMKAMMSAAPKFNPTNEQLAASNRANAAFARFEDDTVHAPEAVVMMGANGKTVGTMVESRLPNRDKLYELSGEELENALDAKNLLAKDSPYAQKPEPEKQAPEKQKTAEKTVEQVKDQGIGF